MTKQPKPKGRPTSYTKEIAEEICIRLSRGESLRAICRDEHLPDESTVRGWALDDREGFYPQYARAREIGLHGMADECFDICDDGRNDWMERFAKDGTAIGWMVNGEAVMRSKLRVETRKWYLSKLAPKTYGERLQLAGDADNPLHVHISQAAESLAKKLGGLGK